jgi:hypothetical protein
MMTQNDWATMEENKNLLELLNLINTVLLSLGTINETERKRAACQNYTRIFQDKFETLGDFRKRFNAAVQTLKQVEEDVPGNET